MGYTIGTQGPKAPISEQDVYNAFSSHGYTATPHDVQNWMTYGASPAAMNAEIASWGRGGGGAGGMEAAIGGYTPPSYSVTYPGSQAGNIWLEKLKGETSTAKTTESRALENQAKQEAAAQAARDALMESSGYKDFVSKRESLQPTYSPEQLAQEQGMIRDILEGKYGAMKRNLVEPSPGTAYVLPSGYQREQQQLLNVTEANTLARQNVGLAERAALQNHQDEVEAIRLALEQAKLEYGANSDLARRLMEIYNTTVAAVPSYDISKLTEYVGKMGEPQTYNVNYQ